MTWSFSKLSISICLVLALTACSGTSSHADVDSFDVAGTTKTEETQAPTITITDDKPMVIDFSASWCPPCQQLKPIYAKLASKYDGKVTMVTVDVDDNHDMADKFGVNSIPTLIFFDRTGTQVDRVTGFIPEQTLDQKLHNLENMR